MVVFYLDIINRIIDGGVCNYSQEQLITLDSWKNNDKRSKLIKAKERTI